MQKGTKIAPFLREEKKSKLRFSPRPGGREAEAGRAGAERGGGRGQPCGLARRSPGVSTVLATARPLAGQSCAPHTAEVPQGAKHAVIARIFLTEQRCFWFVLSVSGQLPTFLSASDAGLLQPERQSRNGKALLAV